MLSMLKLLKTIIPFFHELTDVQIEQETEKWSHFLFVIVMLVMKTRQLAKIIYLNCDLNTISTKVTSSPLNYFMYQN